MAVRSRPGAFVPSASIANMRSMTLRQRDPPVLVARSGRPPSVEETAHNLRECPQHGRIVHYRIVSKTGSIGWRCRRCEGAKVTRRKQLIRRILIQEAGGCCRSCGYDRCGMNLVFHHLDPMQKSFSMSAKNGRSLAAFREEAKKCVLLCANCHGEVETGITPCPAPAAATPSAGSAASM